MEDEEEDVAEGMLLVELEPNNGNVEVRGKLSTRPMMLEDQANLRADSLVMYGTLEFDL
jgi:hypothetical protein